MHQCDIATKNTFSMEGNYQLIGATRLLQPPESLHIYTVEVKYMHIFLFMAPSLIVPIWRNGNGDWVMVTSEIEIISASAKSTSKY